MPRKPGTKTRKTVEPVVQKDYAALLFARLLRSASGRCILALLGYFLLLGLDMLFTGNEMDSFLVLLGIEALLAWILFAAYTVYRLRRQSATEEEAE